MNCHHARALCLAAVFATIAATAGGCSDNKLPPVPVPRVEKRASLPRWYPEKPWTAKEGESRVYIEGKIVFETGSDRIQKFGGSEKVMQTLLQFMIDHPEVTRMRVEGHTDDLGDEEKNNELSAKRALAVCNWLVDHGVSHLRLIAVGFGESKPMAPNEMEMGRSENRRTEFHVAEVNGRAYLNKDPSAGGTVVDVLSAEERKAQEEVVPPPQIAVAPPSKFKATGNEVKKVNPVKQIEIDPTATDKKVLPPAPKKTDD
jgi:outer membrane protein OmpA-like peptidoglycan-associated protein